MNLIAQIPHSGFYDSTHSMRIDDALEQLTQDADGNQIPELSAEIQDKIYDTCNFKKLRELMSADYVECIKHQTGLQVEFESVQSPKFYNFQTDRVFAHISPEEVQRIYAETDKAALAVYIKERFTSRDGFSSFYSPNLSEWNSDPTTWDHNELGSLIEVWLAEQGYDEQYLAWDMQEFCNGEFDQWFSECVPNLTELLQPIYDTFPTDNRHTENLNLFP